MRDPEYGDLPPETIPEAQLPGGGRVRVIAGSFDAGSGPLRGPIGERSTEPVYFDVRLPAGGRFEHLLPDGHNAFVHPYEGRVRVGPGDAAKPVEPHAAGVLSERGRVLVHADVEIDGADGGAIDAAVSPSEMRFLLIAGRPIGEPVAQYGPFVMNTAEEIRQALLDLQSGEFQRAR